MKRRAFIKSMGLGGTAIYVPTSLTISSLLNEAYAASPDYQSLNYTMPDTSPNAATNAFPQVINIFLYGGPSELAGNLTNIQEIETTSQTSYEDNIRGITRFTNDADPGLITEHGFWSGAGGDAMEYLVTRGHMTVYRTMMKRYEDSRSHRQSIFMNQKGTLDIENSPGIGTRIAKMLETHLDVNANLFPDFITDVNGTASKSLLSLVLPFVSFEGDTVLYAPDPEHPVSALQLKAVTLNERFENPYTRNDNLHNAELEALVNTVVTETQRTRFSKVVDGFRLRQSMEGFIQRLDQSFQSALPTVTESIDWDEDVTTPGAPSTLVYPNNNNDFASQVRAAVTLAIENPDSKFITVSNNGLGGFDDHNNGRDNYPRRMEDLFTTLRAAMKHIKYSGTQTAGVTQTPGGLVRRTDNIIINVFGDFGRRVNLNDSVGWDHGNCQNLYTLGGQSVRGAAALGKVVGLTRRVGRAGTNDQVQEPASGSYEFEPMSLAASIYRYFGAQNPEMLTADPTLNTAGSPPIDEAVAGEPVLFT